MDPVARRRMWNVISSTALRDRRCVILTTHLMEESEALCSRVGIMLRGKLVCLGSLQHLKTKYGNGYHLHLKLPAREDADPSGVARYLMGRFPGTELLEQHGCLLKFRLLNGPSRAAAAAAAAAPLSVVFRELEQIKASYGVQEYGVSQTTLEQLFVSLTDSTKSGPHRL